MPSWLSLYQSNLATDSVPREWRAKANVFRWEISKVFEAASNVVSCFVRQVSEYESTNGIHSMEEFREQIDKQRKEEQSLLEKRLLEARAVDKKKKEAQGERPATVYSIHLYIIVLFI